MTNLPSSNLYSVDIEDFKKILDDNMNYHYMETGPLENEFDNYVYNVLDYFKESNTVLNVGCGFGGCSRILQKHIPSLKIKCITNVKSQYEYTSNYFQTNLINAEDYSENFKYDIAVFFDSLCHMNADKVISNAYNYTNKILIKDYAFLNDDYYYSKRWDMHFRSQSNWNRVLLEHGFKVKSFEINNKVLVDKTHKYWYNKLKEVESNHPQIEMLKIITQQKEHKPGKAYCTIYAEKI